MANTFTLGDITVEPGRVGRGTVAKVRLGDSQETKVPAIVVNGIREGSTLLVTAGVHGREVSCIGAVLDAVRQMDPSQMSGRVIAIPVANPLAVQLGTYITPHDNTDINSRACWPTDPRGTITQRLAAGIEQAIAAADYVIDLHANPLPSMPFVLSGYGWAPDERVRNEAQRFAAAFGLTIIEEVRSSPTSIREVATHRGKPGITPELSGDRYLWESITSVGTRGILNCAKVVGILPGSPDPQVGVAPVLKGDFVAHGMLRSNTGGFLKVHKEPGEFIEEGEHVATIIDCYGEALEEIHMPINGYCWAFLGGSLSQTWVVTEGDGVAYMFTSKG